METRKLIQKVAEGLGYRPDPVLQQMGRQRWQVERANLQESIAYVSHGRWNTYGAENHLTKLARRSAEKFGYKVDEIEVTPDLSATALKRIIRARGIRGVLFHAFRDEQIPPSLQLDWTEISGVCCPAGRLRPSIHAVNFDTFLGARLAFAKAREAGYRRIGAALFSHRPPTEDDYARKGGILCEQLETPEADRVPLLTCDFGDEAAFRKWFEEHRPDCVIGFTNMALRMLEGRGIRAPKDVGFVSLTVERGQEVTGVLKDWEELMGAAVELLVTEIRENNTGVPRAQKYILIEPVWMEGKTLGRKG